MAVITDRLAESPTAFAGPSYMWNLHLQSRMTCVTVFAFVGGAHSTEAEAREVREVSE